MLHREEPLRSSLVSCRPCHQRAGLAAARLRGRCRKNRDFSSSRLEAPNAAVQQFSRGRWGWRHRGAESGPAVVALRHPPKGLWRTGRSGREQVGALQRQAAGFCAASSLPHLPATSEFLVPGLLPKRSAPEPRSTSHSFCFVGRGIPSKHSWASCIYKYPTRYLGNHPKISSATPHRGYHVFRILGAAVPGSQARARHPNSRG